MSEARASGKLIRDFLLYSAPHYSHSFVRVKSATSVHGTFEFYFAMGSWDTTCLFIVVKPPSVSITCETGRLVLSAEGGHMNSLSRMWCSLPVLCHCEQSIRLTPNPISCYVIKRSLSNDCNVCVTTVWSALPACVVNKLGEEISHVRRRSTGKHASKCCLPFSIISFFSFDNVRLNIDALKLLQRSWGEREWALLWQRTKGVLRVLLTGWGIWKRRKQKDLR